MKNKILFTSLSLIFILPILTSAQSTTSPKIIREELQQTRNTIKDEVKKEKENLKNSVENRRNEAVIKIRERLDKFNQNLIERFDASIDRLEKIANRLDSRIAKIKARNIDTTSTDKLMVIARNKIETAKIAVTNIASTTANTNFGTTTAELKGNFNNLKTEIENTKKTIKEAQIALLDAVKSLRASDDKMKEKENKEASTTPKN